MRIDGVHTRTIWLAKDGRTVEIIDQTRLPHRYEIVPLSTMEEAAHAIKAMLVRGAPLIGATAAYGMALAMTEDSSDAMLARSHAHLYETRPTAVNLRWGLEQMRSVLGPLPAAKRVEAAYAEAARIADEDVAICSSIGDHGAALFRTLWEEKGRPDTLNILTHCNAGWLATVDWGTATAPIYKLHDAGLKVHVWVDETRPRNQGASLTAFELNQHGVPHTVIPDNTGGHLMQHGMVDACIVGTDRTTASGDVCNKIGTYLKALAAQDNGVPFYVALPSPTIDWTIDDGLKDIPIETRDAREVTHISGETETGTIETVRLTPKGSKAINYGFDVTPAKYVTGLITERGVCPATKAGMKAMFPDLAGA
jgi:methylthioribose-1-phosphate isomerase